MSGIVVKALPWHSNTARDGTWWIGYENSEAGEYDEGQHVIVHKFGNRYSGASHAEAVSALVAHIADAQEALEALKRQEPYGEFSE